MHGADLAIYKSNGLTDELRILCWQLRSETVISVDHDIEKENIYMKLLVRAFEQLSCLKINFGKNELFCFGQAKQQETIYSSLFGCKLGSYPFRYLGIPMHYKKVC
jgi:hypothetical protein